MNKIDIAVKNGFKVFKGSSALLEEVGKQFTTLWVLFEYSDDQDQKQQSFALITAIIDDVTVLKTKTTLSYLADECLSEMCMEFDKEHAQILYYKIIEDEEFDVDGLKFEQWDNQVEIDGQLLYFRVPIRTRHETKDRIFIGWVDFDDHPPTFEMYTALCTPLVDINEHPMREKISFAWIPFIEYS